MPGVGTGMVRPGRPRAARPGWSTMREPILAGSASGWGLQQISAEIVEILTALTEILRRLTRGKGHLRLRGRTLDRLVTDADALRGAVAKLRERLELTRRSGTPLR